MRTSVSSRQEPHVAETERTASRKQLLAASNPANSGELALAQNSQTDPPVSEQGQDVTSFQDPPPTINQLVCTLSEVKSQYS